MALVVRMFVGAVAERWGVPDQVRDDLRLAASELFSVAVEAGEGDPVVFTISSEDSELSLRADGVHTPGTSASARPDTWGGRFDLIRALFPDAEVDDAVRIRVPAGA
jgi:histidine kinase-like protein